MGMIADLFIKLGLKKEGFDSGISDVVNTTKDFVTKIKDVGTRIKTALSFNNISTQFVAMGAGIKAFAIGLTTVSGRAALFAGAMKLVRTAMIGTGIGALVVALGSLVAYFTQSERGADKLERAMSGIKAVFKVVTDRAIMLGEGLWKILSGDFADGWDNIKKAMQGVGSEMSREGRAAMDLRKRYQELEDTERNLMAIQEERRESVAELRLEARDENLSAEERKKKLLQAAKIIKDIARDEKAIAWEKANIFKEQIELGEVRDEQLLELEALQTAAIKLDTDEAKELKQLSREMRQVNNDLEEATKARQEYENILKNTKPLKPIFTELKTKVKSDYDHKGGLQNIVDQITGNSAKPTTLDIEGLIDWKASNKELSDNLDAAFLQPIRDFNTELNNTIVNGMTNAIGSLASGLGELAAGAITGKDFGNQVLKTIGNFMVQMGGLFVAFGISKLLFEKSIKNPFGGGALAIAAGVGMIAAGSAISALASKTSGGGGATSAAASGYSASGSTAAQTLTGNVFFELEGVKLKGVLNNVDRRNNVMR